MYWNVLNGLDMNQRLWLLISIIMEIESLLVNSNVFYIYFNEPSMLSNL